MPAQSTTEPAATPAPAAREPARISSSRAFELLRDELLAIDARALVPVNADVAAAALTVIGVATEIAAYRPALVELCGEAMAKSVDRLDLVARAALHAQAEYRAVESGVDLQPLSMQVGALREALLCEVRALIARNALPPGVVRELAGPHGYKNQCLDVLQLVSVLRADWDVLAAETGLTSAYLDRAEAAANELATVFGRREQGSRSSAADLRQRAFTLLSETYDDVRRMITFLRWKEGDADRIAPSFRGRGQGKRRPQEPSAEVTTGDPVTGAGTSPIPPGMPGAPPFLEG